VHISRRVVLKDAEGHFDVGNVQGSIIAF
jgi:hypothetical protein